MTKEKISQEDYEFLKNLENEKNLKLIEIGKLELEKLEKLNQISELNSKIIEYSSMILRKKNLDLTKNWVINPETLEIEEKN